MSLDYKEKKKDNKQKQKVSAKHTGIVNIRIFTIQKAPVLFLYRQFSLLQKNPKTKGISLMNNAVLTKTTLGHGLFLK